MPRAPTRFRQADVARMTDPLEAALRALILDPNPFNGRQSTVEEFDEVTMAVMRSAVRAAVTAYLEAVIDNPAHVASVADAINNADGYPAPAAILSLLPEQPK